MFWLTAEPIDQEHLRGLLADLRAGALSTFEGLVRNHNEGRAVNALEYESFDELAKIEGEKIIEEAQHKFSVLHAVCVHRIGSMQVGDLAVWVGVSAEHRKAAFEACSYIIDEVKNRLPVWKKEHYSDGSTAWVNCQISSAHEHPKAELPAHCLSEAEFYSRQICLPEVGITGQEMLKKAKVLVIGSGGLGCPALMYLAASGVGTIGICEFDRLETSNLNRQILYSCKDLEQDKSYLATKKLEDLNPFIEVVCHHTRINADNAQSLISQYDMVLDCTDNFETKFLVNDTCVRTKIPLVVSSVYQYEGQVQLVDPRGPGQCLRCLWAEVPEADCVGTCTDAGVLGAVPGILGAMQAMEAIKLILGLPTSLTEHIILVNLLSWEIRKIKALRNNACSVCGTQPAIARAGSSYLALENDLGAALLERRNDGDLIRSGVLPASEHAKCVRSQGVVVQDLHQNDLELDINGLSHEILAGYELVDIREPQEREVPPIASCRAIPMNELVADSSWMDLKSKYLLFCQKGIRSKKLAMQLRQQGLKNVFSVAGGVSAIKLKFSQGITLKA